MDRRLFLATGVGAAVVAHPLMNATAQSGGSTRRPFKVKYAPHFGMFHHHAGKDLIDQLKFAADEGFTAWEDNGMKGRSVADQERVASEMDRLGITMGVFVANTIGWKDPTLSTGKPEHLEQFHL